MKVAGQTHHGSQENDITREAADSVDAKFPLSLLFSGELADSFEEAYNVPQKIRTVSGQVVPPGTPQ